MFRKMILALAATATIGAAALAPSAASAHWYGGWYGRGYGWGGYYHHHHHHHYGYYRGYGRRW
jgi:hypothetical protein